MAGVRLLDPFGFPITSRGPQLIDATRQSQDRPAWPISTDPIGRSVTYQDWRTMLSASRRLWANYPVLSGATSQKAMHSVGRAWDPEFFGEDKDWGKLATEWLRDEWYGVCNVRGANYDFKTSLFLDSICIDRDGDVGTLLTETDTGYPQLQTVAAHRIGVVYGTNVTLVADGPYQGLRIESGVILNSQARAVAFRVISSPQIEPHQDISERDLIHSFDPSYPDQVRGFPAYSGSILMIRDSMQSHQWEQVAMLMASSIGLIESNETGGVDLSDPSTQLGSTTAGATTMTSETRDGGTVRYFKAGTGSKIEAFTPDRPNDMWDRFQDRIIRQALLEMNWPYSLCWKSDGANGTAERSEIEKARTSIKDRQDLLEPKAKRAVGYAVSKAIKLGILPEYKGKDKGGFLRWGFTKPAKFSIDNGRDGESRRRDYLLGVRNLTDILGENGETLEAHLNERAEEVALRKQIQASVATARGVVIDDRDMIMLSPNEQKDGAENAGDGTAAP